MDYSSEVVFSKISEQLQTVFFKSIKGKFFESIFTYEIHLIGFTPGHLRFTRHHRTYNTYE